MMHRDTKEGIFVVCVAVATILAFAIPVALLGHNHSKLVASAGVARGPELFAAGQEVTIKSTGERTIIVSVNAGSRDHRWHYWCRVAFGRKDYPIGVITNPTQITKTYELVDFYGFELEAR